MTKRLLQILCWSLLLLTAAPALAANGVKGRIAWEGQLVPGVTVRAYRAIADIAADKVVAASAASSLDGTYLLELPPGDYYLTARDYEGRPTAGKHFCYYSGGPVQVTSGRFATVGFNLIRIPAEEAAVKGDVTGLRGSITFQGEALEKCYLYVYKDASKGFRGPAYFVQPVEKGEFRLRLPPGEYYLLARKRAKGGQFGPIEVGDYFNYYYGNPVKLEKGETKAVIIETITRLEMLEKGEEPPFRGFTGLVLGPGGKPAAGLHVFAYRDQAMTGTPDLVSPPTGPDGRFRLALPADGPWYLLARKSFGGPAEEGELYGKFQGTADHSIRLGADEKVREVTIRVDTKRP